MPIIPFMQIINGHGVKRKLILSVNNFQNMLPVGFILVLKAYIVFVIPYCIIGWLQISHISQLASCI